MPAQMNIASPEPDRIQPDRIERNATSAALPLARNDDFDRDVWCLFGLPIDNVSLPQAVGIVEAAVRDRRRLTFVTPNVNILCAALQQRSVREGVLGHDLSLADGAPVVALARMLGAPAAGRCAGSDLFEALRARPGIPGRRIRVFIFGGREGAAQAAVEALNADRGGVEGVGFLNPGFGDLDSMSADSIIDQINAARPDFIVVAIGAARGIEWIHRNADRLTAPVISNLGAVVDFTGGMVRRAPKWVARAGMEWAWRIAQEPSLWRRYWRDAQTLAGVGLLRAVPLALAGMRRPSSPVPASATPELFAERVVVRLAGDQTAGSLGMARAAFRTAAQSGRDVVIDYSRIGAIDPSFMGLLLMLEKRLASTGRSLRMFGAPARIRRQLRMNGVAYTECAHIEDTGASDPIADEARTA